MSSLSDFHTAFSWKYSAMFDLWLPLPFARIIFPTPERCPCLVSTGFLWTVFMQSNPSKCPIWWLCSGQFCVTFSLVFTALFSFSDPTLSKAGKKRESESLPFYFGWCFSWREIWWALLLTFCPLDASKYIHWDCTGIQYACKHWHSRAKQWNSSDINHPL